jgi:hypothetical protein
VRSGCEVSKSMRFATRPYTWCKSACSRLQHSVPPKRPCTLCVHSVRSRPCTTVARARYRHSCLLRKSGKVLFLSGARHGPLSKLSGRRRRRIGTSRLDRWGMLPGDKMSRTALPTCRSRICGSFCRSCLCTIRGRRQGVTTVARRNSRLDNRLRGGCGGRVRSSNVVCFLMKIAKDLVEERLVLLES